MKKNKYPGFVIQKFGKICVSVLLAILFNSCASMGPKTIPSDGFNYNERISLQQNEQILLNIVRLRYAEVPLFLTVSSVINQYSRDGRASVSGSNLFGTPKADANLNTGWSDRPTITYTPMGGQAFSESLLQPLPPAILFFLIQSGWSPTRMLTLTTSSINGIKNGSNTARFQYPPDKEFITVIQLLETFQQNGILGMEIGGTDAEPTLNIHFPAEIQDDSLRVSVHLFKEILGLNTELNSFPVRYGQIQKNNSEIFLHSHSLLEIFFNISGYIDVPYEHVDEGRTYATLQPQGMPIIKINSSKEKPDIDYISIKTRDYWYYIDDSDLESKTTFGILQILLSMAKDSSPSKGPLISIGN
ncbi:hypothetical protein [Maribellus sediminis]|uniref:hypothetical protein n=1 Tax=Maribellus sediminis TaxID=2696285 RepID=UPI00143037B9|nr:hypothetical protein [Maribellus sediminis]